MTAEAEAAPETAEPEVPEKEAEESSDKYLKMSDEEFLKINQPDGSKDKDKDKEPKEGEEEPAAEGEAEKPAKEFGGEPSRGEPEKKTKVSEKSATPGSEKPDYANFYKMVMTPFKANGKTVEMKSPEDVLRLMQMGAGYGKKMQEIQPHLKVIRMLDKNNLLDENRLSYLIELNNRNPDAIKKLVKDVGIDPLDLNTDDPVNYVPRNHAVSDKEVVFHQAVGDIRAQPGGIETLDLINQTWDQESKALLWDSPDIMGIMFEQRQTGIYDQIVAEMDRQKMLGKLSGSVPFLEAYKNVGEQLVKTDGFKRAPIQPQPGTRQGNGQQPQVIATRAGAPKSQASNSDKAAAAFPTRTTQGGKINLTVNPLQMSDDEFMKHFNGRSN